MARWAPSLERFPQVQVRAERLCFQNAQSKHLTLRTPRRGTFDSSYFRSASALPRLNLTDQTELQCLLLPFLTCWLPSLGSESTLVSNRNAALCVLGYAGLKVAPCSDISNLYTYSKRFSFTNSPCVCVQNDSPAVFYLVREEASKGLLQE